MTIFLKLTPCNFLFYTAKIQYNRTQDMRTKIQTEPAADTTARERRGNCCLLLAEPSEKKQSPTLAPRALYAAAGERHVSAMRGRPSTASTRWLLEGQVCSCASPRRLR